MMNAELSRVFGRIADLMEIDGAEGFRVNTYRRASRTLKDATDDVAVLAAEGQLTKLPGIGKGTADRIQQYIDTGHIDVLDALEEKLPKELPCLLEIQGMGPKKVALVHNELGVESMADLERVIASGEMAALPGLGATSVKKIAEGIAFWKSSSDRTPLGVALPIGETLADRVRKLPGVGRVEIAGSLRRGCETIGDIDLLCDTEDGADVIRAFTEFPDVKRVLAAGDTKGSITVEVGDGRELQIDLRAVASSSFGAAWQYFTGSKAHNVRLREMAVKRKWRLNEYGLFDGEESIAGGTEEDVYAKLELPCPPPELREDRGEFDAPFHGGAATSSLQTRGRVEGECAELEHFSFSCAGSSAAEPASRPKISRGLKPAARNEKTGNALVTVGGILGDLHMHTTASDGKCSIEEMAAAAKALGYEYIAICDHSKSATIASGLSIERMERQIKDVRAADGRVDGIAILVGTECDILPDGSMDYPDDLLAQCDWVVASIHSAMGSGGSGKLSPTERTLAAIENPYVCAIGHPTGRLINRRPAMELDMGEIARAAARTHTFLEINASWQRLDLKDMHVRQALAEGASLTINTDAHHTDQLLQMRYGVTTARRGGARKGDVANCMTLPALRQRIGVMRK